MDELDPRLKSLLREACLGEEPDDRAEQRVRARLIVALGAEPGGSGLQSLPPSALRDGGADAANAPAEVAANSGPSGAAWPAAAKWLGTALWVGASALLLVPTSHSPLPEATPASPTVKQPAPASVATPREGEPPSRASAPAPVLDDGTEPAAASTAAHAPAPVPSESKVPTLRNTSGRPDRKSMKDRPRRERRAPRELVEPASPPDELTLIRGATRAIRDRQPGRALALLSEHARHYPRGMLTQERDGLRAIALCAAGRTSEGLVERERFLRTAPRAPLAGRVRDACHPVKAREVP